MVVCPFFFFEPNRGDDSSAGLANLEEKTDETHYPRSAAEKSKQALPRHREVTKRITHDHKTGQRRARTRLALVRSHEIVVLARHGCDSRMEQLPCFPCLIGVFFFILEFSFLVLHFGQNALIQLAAALRARANILRRLSGHLQICTRIALPRKPKKKKNERRR